MIKKAPSICPVCGKSLIVKRLQCGSCNTVIDNDFSFNVFERLSLQQQEFLLAFVRVEGNIRMLEQLLGISYPTVKNRLTEIKRVLFAKAEPLTNLQILEKLESGELTVQQAKELINTNSY